jgi:acetyl esterase/lipase
VSFPAFVEDAAAAFDVARREAEALGGDPRRVVVMGHSAGAHMAALLALEPRYLGALGRTPAEIAGVVGISGPYVHDFGKVRWLAPVFPDEASRREAMVIAKARPGSPPMFLANGTADVLVPPRNATELAGRLGALGARVELRLYEQAGHADILLGLVDPLAGSSTLAADVAAFLRSLAPV